MKGRLQLTDLERISLAEIGKRLGRMALAEVAQIVRPETILGWHRNLDIGSPKLAGSTRQVEGGWDLVAGGADIWEKSDQFHFLCKPISGDFDIAIRVESFIPAHLYSKAGLDRKSTRLNSSHLGISYAVFCLKK